MKNRYHTLIILLLLFLTSRIKEWMNYLKFDQENQETIESLWIMSCTGYVFYVLYKLYNKYPKIFNPDYKKQLEYEKKQKATITNFQNNLSNTLEKVKVVDTSKIEEKIRINEEKITSFDRKYLEDLIRLSNHIHDFKQAIEERINEIANDLSSVYDSREIRKEINNLNQNLQDLYLITFSMIESLVNKDLITYHKLYESLDKLGVFESNFEKKLAGNLKKISADLHGIKSTINYSNILLTYNTYQLNSVSKGLNKINKESSDIKREVSDIRKDIKDIKKKI